MFPHNLEFDPSTLPAPENNGYVLPDEQLAYFRGYSHGQRAALYLLAQDHAEIAYAAHHDPLTNLPNRLGFVEHADHLVRENNDPQNLYMMVIDLDQFKALNDTYGHKAGDEMLQHIGSLLYDNVRMTNHTRLQDSACCRSGGDEFLAMFDVTPRTPTETTPDERITIVTERLQAAFQNLFDSDERYQNLGFGASIGVVQYREGENLEAWMDRADRAMYLEKRARKTVER